VEKWDVLQQQVDVDKRLRKQLEYEKDLADVLNDLDYFLDSEGEVNNYLQDSDSASGDDPQVSDIPLLQVSYQYEQQEDYQTVCFQ